MSTNNKETIKHDEKKHQSDCCNAKVLVVGDSFGEGTMHWECKQCGKSCNDIYYSQVPTVEEKTSNFSRFFREGAPEEKKEVMLEVARQSVEDQKAQITIPVQNEWENTVETLAMAVTHSEQGSYDKNKKFVEETLSPLLSKVRAETIEEIYQSATLYSDGSYTLLHNYIERKYPEVLSVINKIN